MKLRVTLLMLIKASGDKISSKTKIQKESYFLSVRLGKDFKFRAHYYGPYSPLVDYALDELITLGFIEETETTYGAQKDGFEIVRYDYSLTSDGKAVVGGFINNNRKEYREIETFVTDLKRSGNPDYQELSVAAKAHFILSKKESLTAAEIKKEAKDFNWDLKQSSVSKATKILRSLNLLF